jgi:hypothetical protein
MNGIPLQGASSDLYDMRARVSTRTQNTHTHTHTPIFYKAVTQQWSVDYQLKASRLEFTLAVYCIHLNNLLNGVPILAARGGECVFLLARHIMF